MSIYISFSSIPTCEDSSEYGINKIKPASISEEMNFQRLKKVAATGEGGIVINNFFTFDEI